MDVKIMGRDYRVACPPDHQEQLLKVVALVDEKMTDIAGKTKNAIPERIAVMAAMSIAQELLAKPTVQPIAPDEINDTQPMNDSAALASNAENQARLSALTQCIDRLLQESISPTY
jgi:cell division protein ZapA (FtsZ GTPase activity inhibitor)